MLNCAWQVDGTFFPCELEGVPGSRHYILYIIDVAINLILGSKVFYSKNGYDRCTANQAIKVISKAIDDAKIERDLIIHTDRDGCFTSKAYYDFIQSKPFIIGSMTDGGRPDQNAVIERFHHTNKNQFKDILESWPNTVKYTRDLQIIVDRNTRAFNDKARCIKNYGFPPSQARNFLIKNQESAPKILIQPEKCNNLQLLDNEEHSIATTDISRFKFLIYCKESRSMHSMDAKEYESIKRDKDIVDSLTTVRVNQGLIIDTQDYHNKLLEDVTLRQDEQIDYTKQILDIVKPKPKKKSKGIRPRDPLEMSIFDAIMSSPKPKRAHAKSWGRFKITCSILFFGGLRLNEVAALGPSEIEEITEKEGKTERLGKNKKKQNKEIEQVVGKDSSAKSKKKDSANKDVQKW